MLLYLNNIFAQSENIVHDFDNPFAIIKHNGHILRLYNCNNHMKQQNVADIVLFCAYDLKKSKSQ